MKKVFGRIKIAAVLFNTHSVDQKDVLPFQVLHD